MSFKLFGLGVSSRVVAASMSAACCVLAACGSDMSDAAPGGPPAFSQGSGAAGANGTQQPAQGANPVSAGAMGGAASAEGPAPGQVSLMPQMQPGAGGAPPAMTGEPAAMGTPSEMMPDEPQRPVPSPGNFSADRTTFGIGGPSLCGSPNVSVCESFESAPLGAGAPAGFTTDGYGNRTLAVVDDDRARGSRSFRIDVAGGQGAVVGMLVRANLGALGARHFGRSFMKIQAPAPTGFVHWDAFEARGNFQGQVNMVRWASTGTNVGTAATNWSWIYNVQSTDHGEFGSEGPRSAHPVDGQWMCLEWSMEAAAGEARFFYDGAEVDYLHIDSERSEIPVFDSLRVGFQKFQEAAAYRVWIDEIAFDDERIGCNY